MAEMFSCLQKTTRFGGGGEYRRIFLFRDLKTSFSVNGALLHFWTFPKGGPLVCCKIRLQFQRGSIAPRNKGTPVLISARCHNQTSCHNLRRRLRESSVPHREACNSPRHHAPAQPTLPSGKRPQRLTIGLMR